MGYLPCDTEYLCKGGGSIDMHCSLADRASFTLFQVVRWPLWKAGLFGKLVGTVVMFPVNVMA